MYTPTREKKALKTKTVYTPISSFQPSAFPLPPFTPKANAIPNPNPKSLTLKVKAAEAVPESAVVGGHLSKIRDDPDD